MALNNGNGTDTTMLVTPSYGTPFGGGYGGGNGLFGGGDSWLGILFLIALCNGGFGFGGGFGGGYGNMMLGYDFPWLLNGQNQINGNVNGGFRDAQLHDSITSVQSAISALATQLCQCCGDMRYDMSNGFNGVNNSIFGAQTALAQQMNANEITSLNRSFAEQTANQQGFNGVQAGLSDVRYTVAQENCQDRYEAAQNTQNIITALTAGIQSIKDDLCQDRLDAERRENQNLRSELMYARGQASQTEQTAAILANNNAQTALFQHGMNAEVDALYNRLSSCPVPTVPVYGNQRIFNCPQNQYSPCGCNGGNFQ
jgi:hypothetical protein